MAQTQVSTKHILFNNTVTINYLFFNRILTMGKPMQYSAKMCTD